MEIMVGCTEMSPKLRIPAISKLQKVHNMKLVFTALDQQQIHCGKYWFPYVHVYIISNQS